MRFCGILLSLMTLLMALIFEIFRHIACDHVPPLVSCLFVASWLLALEKQAESIQPIMIRELIYQLVTHTLAIQFKDTFAKHFSPYQWQHQASVKSWFMGLKLCWIYIRSGLYYSWMFKMCLIMYFKHPFFRSCGFVSTPWISFSHLFISFTHAHFHSIS
jgi:hypothetical protein